MSAEQPQADDQRRPPHTVGISIGAVVLALAFYVLSAPLVLVHHNSLGISLDTLMTIYGPLDYLYRNSETFAAAMDWYIRHVLEPLFTP